MEVRRRGGSGNSLQGGSSPGGSGSSSTENGGAGGERQVVLPALCGLMFLINIYLVTAPAASAPASSHPQPAPVVQQKECPKAKEVDLNMNNRVVVSGLTLPKEGDPPVVVEINARGEAAPRPAGSGGPSTPAKKPKLSPEEQKVLAEKRKEAAQKLASLNLREVLAECPDNVEAYKGAPLGAPASFTKQGQVRLAAIKQDRRVKMAIYAKTKGNPTVDVVSDQLVNSGVFEERLVNTVYQAFESMSKNTTQFNQSDFLFLDIGSNVGVYSMVMSNLGVNVFSIDAMRNNVATWIRCLTFFTSYPTCPSCLS